MTSHDLRTIKTSGPMIARPGTTPPAPAGHTRQSIDAQLDQISERYAGRPDAETAARARCLAKVVHDLLARVAELEAITPIPSIQKLAHAQVGEEMEGLKNELAREHNRAEEIAADRRTLYDLFEYAGYARSLGGLKALLADLEMERSNADGWGRASEDLRAERDALAAKLAALAKQHPDALPAEPEPGAYLIDDKRLIEWVEGENGFNWQIAGAIGRYRWAHFARPGVTIVRLVPATSTPAVARGDDNVPPIMFPGDDAAERLPGGGWRARINGSGNPVHPARLPRAIAYGLTDSPHAEDVDLDSGDGFGWACCGHLGGWHVGLNGIRVSAVWPAATGAQP